MSRNCTQFRLILLCSCFYFTLLNGFSTQPVCKISTLLCTGWRQLVLPFTNGSVCCWSTELNMCITVSSERSLNGNEQHNDAFKAAATLWRTKLLTGTLLAIKLFVNFRNYSALKSVSYKSPAHNIRNPTSSEIKKLKCICPSVTMSQCLSLKQCRRKHEWAPPGRIGIFLQFSDHLFSRHRKSNDLFSHRSPASSSQTYKTFHYHSPCDRTLLPFWASPQSVSCICI